MPSNRICDETRYKADKNGRKRTEEDVRRVIHRMRTHAHDACQEGWNETAQNV